MTTKSLAKRARISHITTATILRLFLDGPVSARDVVEATGLHLVTVYELLRVFRKEKVIHISAWDVDSMGRDAIAIFSVGQGKDAKRRALSRAQISSRYRERKRRVRMLQLAVAAPQQS